MKPFEISVDSPRRLLTMRMRGFWDAATFDAFAGEFSSALKELHRMGGCEMALVDGSEFAVQSREILGRFADIMRENERYLAKRTASVIPTELNRMQAARVGESLARRDFRSRAEAEAWLFGSEAGAERAA